MTTYSEFYDTKKMDNMNKTFQTEKLFSKKFRIKRNKSDLSNESSIQSWEFTPFPKLYFPEEKKNIIKDINNFNWPDIRIDYDGYNNKTIDPRTTKSTYNKFLKKSNSVKDYFREKGDVTKDRAPAFSFGISRDDCRLPFFKIKEKVTLNPNTTYNLKKYCTFGINNIKCNTRNNNSEIQSTGPEYFKLNYYNQNNNEDNKNIISDYKHNSIKSFYRTREIRGYNYHSNSDWFMKPEPSSYNVNSSITMFTGNGSYPSSTFRSALGRSINRSRCNSYSRNMIHHPSPGPGSYNHYSIFLSHKN